MTEDEARQWVLDRFPRRFETIDRLLQTIVDENSRQNLIARSTVANAWSRHVVDSLQLASFGSSRGLWIDIGSGGGFPGLIIAAIRAAPMLLVEPRRKRAEFLRTTVRRLELDHVEVVQANMQVIQRPASTISARAVGSLAAVFEMARTCADASTQWILPRGQLNDNERVLLDEAFGSMFHVEQSITADRSAIVIAEGRPR